APARHVISLADLLDGNSATDGGKKDEDKPARPVFIPPPPGLRTSLSSKAPAFVPIRKDQAADTFEKAAQGAKLPVVRDVVVVRLHTVAAVVAGLSVVAVAGLVAVVAVVALGLLAAVAAPVVAVLVDACVHHGHVARADWQKHKEAFTMAALARLALAGAALAAAVPRALANSVYVAERCQGGFCANPKFPVLDFDKEQGTCVCRAHPCWSNEGVEHKCEAGRDGLAARGEGPLRGGAVLVRRVPRPRLGRAGNNDVVISIFQYSHLSGWQVHLPAEPVFLGRERREARMR
ncbi:unnamed protein product, partial [Prorocentrum cordatum]